MSALKDARASKAEALEMLKESMDQRRADHARWSARIAELEAQVRAGDRELEAIRARCARAEIVGVPVRIEHTPAGMSVAIGDRGADGSAIDVLVWTGINRISVEGESEEIVITADEAEVLVAHLQRCIEMARRTDNE